MGLSIGCMTASMVPDPRRLPHSIFFGALHALAVDHRSGWAGFSAGLLAALDIERVVHALQRSVVVPTAHVVVDRSPVRQVSRDRPPLAAGTQNEHQAVGHLTNIHCALVTASSCRWDQRL